MFEKKFEERLSIWKSFRDDLETAVDPIQDTINFFQFAPICSMAADPWTQSTWPDPWELIEENNFCEFVKILAICYTLQLTDVLSHASYKIHIVLDNEKSKTYYLLYVDDRVVGFHGDKHVSVSELPNNLYSQQEYNMPTLH